MGSEMCIRDSLEACQVRGIVDWATIKSAIKGMLPKNRLAKVQLDRLHIVRGAEHPYAGMKPQVFEIAQVSQQAK